MSRASRLTLLGTSLFAAGTVFFVHFQQQAEKAVRFSFPPAISSLALLLRCIANISASRPCTKA